MKIIPEKFIPKMFLCRFPLQLGAFAIGIIMCIVLLGTCISAVIQVLQIRDCKKCPDYAIKNAYALSILSCVYCFVMFFINLWFLWGVRSGKTSVVLSWVVVMLIWLSQTLALLVVMLILYSSDISFDVWLLCLILSLIGIAIFTYGILISFAYWRELKKLKVQLQQHATAIITTATSKATSEST